MNASHDRAAMLKAERADAKKRLARAVEDVLEGHALYSVAQRRGVSQESLREALHARGWTPPHRARQRRSRANQLPPPRSENQP